MLWRSEIVGISRLIVQFEAPGSSIPLPVLRLASTAVQSLAPTVRAVTLSNIW
jgi:hypothetical protein